MNGLSPWRVSAAHELAEARDFLFEHALGSFNFKVCNTIDSKWVAAELPDGDKMAFGTVFSPGASLDIRNKENPAT